MIRRRLIFFCGVSISLGLCGGFDGVLRLFFIILNQVRWASVHRVVCCLGDSILFRAIFFVHDNVSYQGAFDCVTQRVSNAL